MNKRCLSIAALFLSSLSAYSATVAFTNFNLTNTGAHGVRDAMGVMVADSSFGGMIGYFTISDTQVQTHFANGNTTSLAAGFTQFGLNTFELNEEFDPGVFNEDHSFDTRASQNTVGSRNIYAVFFKGSSLSTASELFVAKLSSTFGIDPELGAPQFTNVNMIPSSIVSTLVGGAGASYDYGFGSGPLATYQLASVAAIPEPSRALLLLGGVVGLFLRRRR
jgi:hypothetical protein